MDIKKYSIVEYLKQENKHKERYEYHNGSVVPVFREAGGTHNHSKITINISGELNTLLRKTSCSTYDSNLKVHIEKANAFVYPDSMVVCGPPKFYENRNDIITNPMLIIEVLSPSIPILRDHDRGEKFLQYRSLASFKEYVLISSDKPWIETFYKKKDGHWRISSAIGLDSSIHFYSINLTIPLNLIYEKTLHLKNVQTKLDL